MSELEVPVEVEMILESLKAVHDQTCKTLDETQKGFQLMGLAFACEKLSQAVGEISTLKCDLANGEKRMADITGQLEAENAEIKDAVRIAYRRIKALEDQIKTLTKPTPAEPAAITHTQQDAF